MIFLLLNIGVIFIFIVRMYDSACVGDVYDYENRGCYVEYAQYLRTLKSASAQSSVSFAMVPSVEPVSARV